MAKSFWDSGESSTLKPSPSTFTTVKQAPLIAIESPIFALCFALILRVLPAKLLTFAISLIKPVKMITPLFLPRRG